PFTSIPHSAFRTPHCSHSFRIPHSFTRTGVIPAIHNPRGTPFGGPVIPPLLVRRLGHDRRYLCRHALLVERYVRHVAGIGVPPPTREHVLGDDLDAHFHRRAARDVDAGIRGQELAHVDRLLEVHFVDRHGDARLRGVADRGHGGHPVHERQD